MIRLKDQTIIGVTKAIAKWLDGSVHMATKISHFYDWISHKTGLNLPKCERQAYVFP